MAKSSEHEPGAPSTSPPRRVYVRYPANWTELAEAEKQARAQALAQELRRALRPVQGLPLREARFRPWLEELLDPTMGRKQADLAQRRRLHQYRKSDPPPDP